MINLDNNMLTILQSIIIYNSLWFFAHKEVHTNDTILKCNPMSYKLTYQLVNHLHSIESNNIYIIKSLLTSEWEYVSGSLQKRG